MTAIPEDEKDYSNYFQVTANTVNILVLLSGFTFTGITILLSQYPALGNLTVQFILFFLAYLFFFFMFLLSWFNAHLLRLCRNRPPVTREIAGLNRLILLGYTLLQLAVVLMFLVWNLLYLSLASGVVLAMFVLVEIRGMIRIGRLHSNEEDKT